MNMLVPADLIVITARVLEVEPDTALEQLDTAALQGALAEPASLLEAGERDPAPLAAALLRSLLHTPWLPNGQEQVALIATAQFLALNGMDLDLDPPEATKKMVAEVAGESLSEAELIGWLAPRLSIRTDDEASDDPRGIRQGLSRWLSPRRRERRQEDPFHRFTDRARTVLVLAQNQARLLRHNYVGTEHLLLGLLSEGDGLAADVLATLDAGHSAIRDQVVVLVSLQQQAPHPANPELLRQVRLAKRAAIDTGDFDTAAALRDLESRVLTEEPQRPASTPGTNILITVLEENRRLGAEIDRLLGVLSDHGIDPDNGTSKAANA